MPVTRKPVKVLSDLLTRKQIIKQDLSGSVIFNVNEVQVSSSLPLTASEAFLVAAKVSTTASFDNINVVTSALDTYNIYDVDQAFHAIDTAIATANGPDIQTAYRLLRYNETGNFESDGTKIIILPKTGSNPSQIRFPAASLDFINVQISVRESGSTGWYNDLLSVQTVVSGAGNDEVWILLDAEILGTEDSYRLTAINENPDDYVIS